MNTYITRKQVREINRKIFANDLIYSDDNSATLEEIISSIIQRYNPEDKIARVPSIIEIKESSLNKEMLDSIMLLNVNSVYIQINNRLLGNSNNLDIVKQLKSAGYKIIIELNANDKIFTIANIIADIIRIDIHNIPEAMVNSDLRFTCKMFAYNVDSANSYALAETFHIDLYEGTYVSEESSIKLEIHEEASFNYMEILSILNNKDLEIKDLAKAIGKDSLMTAQVIRLSNSVYFRGNDKISSIEQAIIRIGIDTLKKWIFLLQFNRRDNEHSELLQISYSRALFCERITKESRRLKLKSEDAYLIGLFSTLDALTGKQIDKQISTMNLSKDIEDALIYREGDGGKVLNIVKAYEEANWPRVTRYVDELGLSKEKMSDIYFYCIDEVTKLWSSLTELGGVE